MDLETGAGIAESIAKTLAIVVGGIWAWRRFVRQREDFPFVQFEVGIEFVGRQGENWIVELRAKLTNQGRVRHEISRFDLDLRALFPSDVVSLDGPNAQANFRTKLFEASWLPKPWHTTFVDPGISTHYSFVGLVPTDATFILLHGRFDYASGGSFHTAEAIRQVPRECGESQSRS